MCLIVANNWNNTTNAGVWNANFNNTRSNSNNNVGFRADYSFFLKPQQRIVELQGCIIQRYAKSDERPLFGRATEDQRRRRQQ
jgi:hypothetical protein